MKRAKNYMIAYKEYAKTERAKIEELRKSNMYSEQYIAEQSKIVENDIKAKHQEYLKGINEIIDEKAVAIKRPDTNAAEYQAAVTNIFTKVQLLGVALTPKLLKEILAPAVERQDNSTIEAVRNFIVGLANFPGGVIVKNELLESAPRVVNQADLLDYAKEEVTKVFNDNGFLNDNMKSSITMNYLEQSGVFEL